MSTLKEADFQRIRDAANAVVAKQHLPGIAIGVVVGDDLVFSEGFGYADIESKTPQDPARRHRIASVTKTMAGLCVMALVDEGKLRLDDRVMDLLPDVAFDGPAETMTIRHLLTHTSGIGEAPTVGALAAVSAPVRSAVKEPGAFATLYPQGIVVEAVPGTKRAYCNNGFALLGEIVVRAEQSPMHDVMQRRIFGPLGMADTDALDTYDDRLTTGYHHPTSADYRDQFARAGISVPDETPVDGYNVRGEFRSEFNRGMLAAGAVQSNIPDMARYASAMLRRGAGIVRPETFDAMVAPQYCPDPRLINWGLAFGRTPKYGRELIGHGGSFLGGWNSDFAFVPGENIAVIQHINVVPESSAPAFNAVLRAVFNATDAPLERRAVNPEILASAPGIYELTPGRLTNFRPATRLGRLTITANDGGLCVRSRWGGWKDELPMLPADPNDPAFFAVEPAGRERAHVVFTRDATGRVDGMRCDELYHFVRRDLPAE
jgi:CubicO group peptidase (beta-lactamase class C family)